jgi:hypothetical protein
MARHQARPALRQEIDGGHTGGLDAPTGGSGQISTQFITAYSDTCINRENPQRKVGGRTKLVCGYDTLGQFDNAIPHGNTHGYWTLPRPRVIGTVPTHLAWNQYAKPKDGAGTGGNYIARILLHFKIGHTEGPTLGDRIEAASLLLWCAKQKNSESNVEYNIHRLHSPAEHAYHGQTFGFTENATWYEHDFSDGITHTGDWNANLGGLTGEPPPGTSGPRWHFEGLGVTGFTAGAAIHSGDYTGVTSQWSDFSGSTGNVGYGGHYQTLAGGISAGITAFGPLVYDPSGHSEDGGFLIKLDDITPHVADAIENYNGHLQLLIKLKDDHIYETDGYGNNKREYIVLNSNSALINPPTIMIKYRGI